MTITDHRQAEGHSHTHGPTCGHEAVIHEDHVDYLHDGHLHHEARTSPRKTTGHRCTSLATRGPTG